MKGIVGIKFDIDSQLKYFYVGELKVRKNLNVIAKTERGLELGKIVTDIHQIDNSKLHNELMNILRIATKRDYNNYKKNKELAHEALIKCRELVTKMSLEMNVMESFFTLDKDHLIFHFYADNRIDFRNLAKELAYIYKTRIELRQIGVRDKAQKIGGIGGCGQELCCSRFLNNFDSVTISMAKDQNLSLNPTKINGVCGRLLCCLKYEEDCYKSCKKVLPKIGQTIETKNGIGKVISLDILKQKYKIQFENGNILEEEISIGNNK